MLRQIFVDTSFLYAHAQPGMLLEKYPPLAQLPGKAHAQYVNKLSAWHRSLHRACAPGWRR